MTSPVMWLSGGCGSTLIPIRIAEPTTRPDHVIDFLHRLTVRCVQLLDLSAVGLLLTDQLGALHVVAASTERARLLELLQLQTDEGPCPECVCYGAVSAPTAGRPGRRAPRATPPASASERSVVKERLRMR